MLQHQLRALVGSGLALLLGTTLTGCGGGGGGGSGTATGTSASATHAAIALKDAQGVALTAASTAPFSSRQTCGGCHDVDKVAGGYHFHQGRTDPAGNVVVRDNYFADGRAWVRSSGMYGKW